MTFEETLQFMRNTPWSWYKTDSIPGASTVRELGTDMCLPNWGGNPTVSETFFRDRRDRIDETGVTIHQTHFPSGWVGVDEYDYTAVDFILEQLLKDHPERWVMPRVKLDAPFAWMREHPEEIALFWEGPQTREEILSLIGTKHQIVTNTGSAPEARMGRQSHCSRLWLKDACEALRRLIEHIESSPYADRIIGYMPAFGECGESFWWGAHKPDANLRGDFGATHRRCFYEWAVQKYVSPEALRKAWRMPDLTADNLPIPTPQDMWVCPIENWKETKNLRSLLLADDPRTVDYYAFHSETVVSNFETFCRLIKETTGKPAGCFYGYTVLPDAGYLGQLALNQAIASPWIDFLSAPKSYAYCMAGEPSESQGPVQSIARKKLWIEENDMRSYLALKSDPIRAPKTLEESIVCYWRELYRALTGGFSFWWMNLHAPTDDWYTDENLVAMFKQQADFFKKWSPVPRRSVAEVLWVEDDASEGHMGVRWGLLKSIHHRLNREVRLCGAPVDHHRIEDLEELDLSQYKFIVFQHAFVMPKDQWERIRARIRPDAHILWNYAAGLLDPEWNPDNQLSVTGFQVMETPDRLLHADTYRHYHHHKNEEVCDEYPHLAIVPCEGQEILQTSPDGCILTARVQRGEGASIFAADITLRAKLLRKLMEDAGVFFPAPLYCSVQADDKLTGFFPQHDVMIRHTFEGTWRNVLTGETVSGELSFPLRGKDFAIFEKLK